ncbi:MAG: serine/threonine protein kinase [Acidobacteria bacterium]|nr:serine/threonine protein kinase [Acidobacteriota bacterium]
MPQAGEQIGPYTLVRQLGRGAFGIVWLAERRGTFATTQVAIKLILDDEPDLDAIAQESQLWAKLGGHPNVLPIIEADKYDDQIVIVSEYAPDGTLNDWLKKHSGVAPSIESAISMAIGILNGLEHLHSKKIIHRDLKPANILLQNETPRLADFGLARVLRSSMKSGGVAGTPAYMAPEVFDGERSVQSDIWSVGVILYQLLSGRLPFPQADLMALLGAIIKNDAALLPDYVPFPLAQVVANALQKNPLNRYQSVAEMRNTLQSIISNGEILSKTLYKIDDTPTVSVNTAKQTNPEQTMATLAHLPSSDSSLRQNANRTQEQTPARTTQESISNLPPTILEIPSTEKILLSKTEPQSDKINTSIANSVKALGSRKVTAIYVAIFAVLFLAGLAVMLKVSSTMRAEKTNLEKGVNDLHSPPAPPSSKVDITDSTAIKDSNKLSMEIGKRIALIEKELETLPKGKERSELREAFEEIRDGFEETSLEDIRPETLRPVYEGYIAGLNGLMGMVERAKSSSKVKVKTTPVPSEEAVNISKPTLPASPDIPIPEQALEPQFSKPIDLQPTGLGMIPSPEDLKELRRRTKETRQLLKEAQRKIKEEKQSDQPSEPPPISLRRKFLEKAARGQERRQE